MRNIKERKSRRNRRIDCNDIVDLTKKHSTEVNSRVMSVLADELLKDDSLFINTGEGTLWELDLPSFIITIDYDSRYHRVKDCIVVSKSDNKPQGIHSLIGHFLSSKISTSLSK